MESLTTPATYCYQFLATSKDTYSNLKLEAANRKEESDSELTQLEATVFRDLVEQLRGSDDDFNVDPTDPLEADFSSGTRPSMPGHQPSLTLVARETNCLRDVCDSSRSRI